MSEHRFTILQVRYRYIIILHAYSIEQDMGVRFSLWLQEMTVGNNCDTTSGQGNYYKTIDFYGTDQTFTTPNQETVIQPSFSF